MNIFNKLFIKISPLCIFWIKGDSMFPTLSPGEKIITASVLFSKLKIQDIVICCDPRTQLPLVKRISAIKNNTYFVTGDNKKKSTDSRVFGWLQKKDILAKVIYPKNRYNI